MEKLCWYRADTNANSPWIKAVFHGFYQSGDVKTGLFTFALVVAVEPDFEPTGYCFPKKIYDFKSLRFDEAILPETE